VHPYQQPAQPRRRTGRTIFIILAVVAVVCCLGVGGVGYGVYKILEESSEAPREATHAFVADLAAGNTDAAYQKLCTATRGRYTKEQFVAVVQQRPKPSSASINGFDIQNSSTAEIRTTLKLADGSEQGHTFELVKEGDAWLVCGDPY